MASLRKKDANKFPLFFSSAAFTLLRLLLLVVYKTL
jgi:hypothetical protein